MASSVRTESLQLSVSTGLLHDGAKLHCGGLIGVLLDHHPLARKKRFHLAYVHAKGIGKIGAHFARVSAGHKLTAKHHIKSGFAHNYFPANTWLQIRTMIPVRQW